MNEVTKKIRGYSRRQPVTAKKFKFSNDLLVIAAYARKGGGEVQTIDLT